MELSISPSRYDQAIILLFIAGLTLRIIGLTFNSLWLDEISTLMYSSKSVYGIWQAMLLGEFNPPLFYWIEHIMLMVFGTSDFILRIAPAIFGALTVPVVYLLGKRLYDAPAGFFAAMIMASSPWNIVYSQEARAYTLVVLLSTIALYYFFGKGKYDKLICAAVLGVALWTHFYAIILAVILIVSDIVYGLKNKNVDIKPLAVYLIIALPLIIGAYHLISTRVAIGTNFGITGIDLILQTFYQFFGFSPVAILFLGLTFVGIYQLYKKNRYAALIMALVIFGTILISIPISYKTIVVPRYFAFIIAPLFVCAGGFYGLLGKGKKKEIMAYVTIGALILMLSPSFLAVYTVPIKPDYRTAADYVSTIKQPYEKVIFVPDYPAPFTFYYKGDVDRIRNISEIYTKRGDIYVISMIDVDWYPNETELRAWLDNNTTVLQTFQYVEVRRYNGTLS